MPTPRPYFKKKKFFYITWHLIRTKDSARLLFSAASGRFFTIGELIRAEKISERLGNLARSSVT